MGASLYEPDDPFCKQREPDERNYSIDHFYKKLFTLPDTMKTEAGKAEAHRRADFMRGYLEQFEKEIGDQKRFSNRTKEFISQVGKVQIKDIIGPLKKVSKRILTFPYIEEGSFP